MKRKYLSFKEVLWLFILGCFLGFILETTWHFVKNGVFINKQGLLYGPFKPIYGLGLILIVVLMYRIKERKFWVKFLVGVLFGSAFEYGLSLFQEYVFHTATWNYSGFKYNIGGRIYLPYCLVWGLIAVICIDFIYPWFKRQAAKVPKKVGQVLTILVGIFMAINVVLTTLAVVRYANRVNNGLKTNAVFRVIDKMYPDEYMKAKFPKLRVIQTKK